MDSSLDPKRKMTSNDKDEVLRCSFCKKASAAVMVQLPSTRKRKQASQPYCMLHYYTTRASRLHHSKVSILNETEMQRQLELDGGGVQQLFAQAFTELQHELAETSARAFTVHQSDPLAVLHDLRGKPKKKIRNPPKTNTKKEEQGGGFLPRVPLPERFLQTQRRQHDIQKLDQLKQSAPPESIATMPSSNPYKRRKSSRKSIWNLAMQPSIKTHSDPTIVVNPVASVTCSCGSDNVSQAGNITGRNSELTKGETWGNKDRSDALVVRYQCNSCGKVWNEEE